MARREETLKLTLKHLLHIVTWVFMSAAGRGSKCDPTRGTPTTALPAHASNWGSAKCSLVGVHRLYLWKTLLRSNLALLWYYFFFRARSRQVNFAGPRAQNHINNSLSYTYLRQSLSTTVLHSSGLFLKVLIF